MPWFFRIDTLHYKVFQADVEIFCAIFCVYLSWQKCRYNAECCTTSRAYNCKLNFTMADTYLSSLHYAFCFSSRKQSVTPVLEHQCNTAINLIPRQERISNTFQTSAFLLSSRTAVSSMPHCLLEKIAGHCVVHPPSALLAFPSQCHPRVSCDRCIGLKITIKQDIRKLWYSSLQTQMYTCHPSYRVHLQNPII